MAITLSVKEIMTKDVISVNASDHVKTAIEVMTRNDVGSVLVMQDGKPAGILTERDILKRVCPENLCAKGVTAGEIMSKPLIHIAADAPIGQASLLMTNKDVRRLMVMEDGEVVGIITQKDVMRETINTFMTLASL